jgi:hypothetical protein
MLTDTDQLARLASPEDRAAATRYLPQVAASLQPAERTWLTAQVAALFAAFPVQDMPKQGIQAAILAYVEDLSEYPQDVIASALRDARRGAETFRPSIKNIRDVAELLVRDRRETLAGLRRVANLAEPEPPKRVTPEAVERIVAKWRMGEKV